MTEINTEEVCFLTGFWRSGSSLLTAMLHDLGMDVGPENHLLLAKGERAYLNPDGFFENYLFMDWSLAVFHMTNSWGHLPPSAQDLNSMTFSSVDDESFCRQSILQIHDDRISNRNKLNCLLRFGPSNIHTYLSEKFGHKALIKNPHFSVMPEVLNNSFPNAVFICVFRNPDSAIQSTRQFIPVADYELYCKYYERMVLGNFKTIFFNYDEFLIRPKESLSKLAQKLQLSEANVPMALKRYKPELVRHQVLAQTGLWPGHLKKMYTYLEENAVNK